MRITFRNKLFDIVIFNAYQLFQSPIVVGVLALCLVVNAWSFWDIVSEATSKYSILIRITTFVILQGACIIAGGATILLLLILTNISRMNKNLLAEHTLTLEPDFITAESQSSRSELKWDAVQKIRRTPSHLFIYLSQHGAIVIPNRTFNSDADKNEFWQYCQTKIKQHNSTGNR